MHWHDVDAVKRVSNNDPRRLGGKRENRRLFRPIFFASLRDLSLPAAERRQHGCRHR